MRNATITIIVVLLIIGGLLFYRNRKGPIYPTAPEKVKEISNKAKEIAESPSQNANKKTVKINLSAQNNSGENGTATLTDENGKTKVVLDLTGAPANVTQPAHIHTGACPNPGAVKYPLNFPTNGKSETTLDISLDQLLGQLPLAVNVHKSATQSNIYFSCGDIKDSSSGSGNTSNSGNTSAPVQNPNTSPSSPNTSNSSGSTSNNANQDNPDKVPTNNE